MATTCLLRVRAPKPRLGGDQPIQACLAALLPDGRLQGRCLALSAAVDKYKPVTRRVAARQIKALFFYIFFDCARFVVDLRT